MEQTNAPAWSDMVLVGIIARAHGLRGQVVVNALTDFPEERFKAGSELWLEGQPDRPVTVESVRLQNGRPVIGFAGVGDVEQAEAMAGRELRVAEHDLQPLAPGTFYHHQLVGCSVVERGGGPVGDVVKVEDGAGGTLLAVNGPRGEVLIPLAEDICTSVDVEARRIEVMLPEGLLELNETRRSRRP